MRPREKKREGKQTVEKLWGGGTTRYMKSIKESPDAKGVGKKRLGEGKDRGGVGEIKKILHLERI